jgi:hypothetical protein
MRENFVATLWPGKGNLAFWAAGLVVAAVAVMALRSCFSVEARERERNRKHIQENGWYQRGTLISVIEDLGLIVTHSR